MSKFDSQTRALGGAGTLVSPVRTSGRAYTHGGAVGYQREPKGELFLLAVSLMVGEDTFYEGAKARDERLRTLTRAVTTADPAWAASFARWLRGSANMRSVSVVVACEYVSAGGPCGRDVIDAVCQRADEPAEVLAYWTLTYGRNVPKPVKRGVGDAVRRLYTERSALKYDGNSRAWRMADVVETCHVKPKAPWQSDLFRWLIDARHNRGALGEVALPMINARAALEDMAPEQRRASLSTVDMGAAGMTWESLSGWLGGPMDRDAWLTVLPSMGYMALIRNLRNFDQAGLTDTDVAAVLAKIVNPDDIAGSRVLPIRMLAAYQQCASDRWRHALSVAADLSMANLPDLPGRSLVLVDVSGSMRDHLSRRGTMTRAEAALLFGAALALRAPDRVALRLFDNHCAEYPVPRGGSLLRIVDELGRFVGGGTDIAGALSTFHTGGPFDRVVLITDEQATTRYADPVPPNVPVYTFNLGGYAPGFLPSGSANRHSIGGLNDAAFSVIATMEARRSGRWPWEVAE